MHVQMIQDVHAGNSETTLLSCLSYAGIKLFEQSTLFCEIVTVCVNIR